MDSSALQRSTAVHHHHHHHVCFHQQKHHHHICRHQQQHHHHHHFVTHHHHSCHHYHSNAEALPSQTDVLMCSPVKVDSKLYHSTVDATDEVLTQREVADEEEEGMDDDSDPIFVMTDEWKEFFAKSEARRRLEKQQMKNKGKKKNKAR